MSDNGYYDSEISGNESPSTSSLPDLGLLSDSDFESGENYICHCSNSPKCCFCIYLDEPDQEAIVVEIIEVMSIYQIKALNLLRAIDIYCISHLQYLSIKNKEAKYALVTTEPGNKGVLALIHHRDRIFHIGNHTWPVNYASTPTSYF